MVNLTRLYTRIGDHGTTHLSDMSVTSKTDTRVDSYGHVDEANAILGLALTFDDLPDALVEILRTIQNELFDVGADLSNPVVRNPAWTPLRIEQTNIDRLETWCDQLTAEMPSLRSFILPGGTPSGAYLHLARTVVRRAERAAWAAAETHGLADGDQSVDGGLNPLAITYLNRLSDVLFAAARLANGTTHEVLWVPGQDREPSDERARKQRQQIIQASRTPDQEEQPPAN